MVGAPIGRVHLDENCPEAFKDAVAFVVNRGKLFVRQKYQKFSEKAGDLPK